MAVLGGEGHVALAEPLAPTAWSCTPSPARQRCHPLLTLSGAVVLVFAKRDHLSSEDSVGVLVGRH